MLWPPTQEMVVQFSLSVARGPWSSGDATCIAVAGLLLGCAAGHDPT